MEWSAAGAPLVAARAVHFAATSMMAGCIIFRTVIAMPVFRSELPAAAAFRRWSLWFTWLSLAVAVVSGAAWLLLATASMSGMPLDEALTADVLSTVVSETQFGQVTVLRAGLAVGVAACLIFDRATIARWLGLATSIAFAASLAWTGHAGSTVGSVGDLHLLADAVHLVAAVAWIGGLVPLILLLVVLYPSKPSSLVPDAVGRFSLLGIVSVAALILTGTINAAILVGSLGALVATGYGQLLLLKLVVFALMLALALTNRLLLTPRLSRSGNRACQWLIRSSAIEFALGLAIFSIVAVLGTMHPAAHLMD
jgi:putative copper resistance protein D